MTLQQAVILAIIQGATEFLPVSSSGHLVLTRSLIGVPDIPILFDLILHLGTVTATVLVYYRAIGEIFRDIGIWIIYRRGEAFQGNVKLFLYIAISTAVTGVAGLLLENQITSIFQSPKIVSVLLITTGLILFTTRYAQKGNNSINETRIHFPLVIGFVQAFAMLPGISRSGSTISAGLFMGLKREIAGAYSFLLSIPSVFGAALFAYATSYSELYEVVGLPTVIVAFLLSFISGYIALRLLLQFLKRGRLWLFSFYCFLVGVIGLTLH
jgi:undecaprenyl-diphosphatase